MVASLQVLLATGDSKKEVILRTPDLKEGLATTGSWGEDLLSEMVAPFKAADLDPPPPLSAPPAQTRVSKPRMKPPKPAATVTKTVWKKEELGSLAEPGFCVVRDAILCEHAW